METSPTPTLRPPGGERRRRRNYLAVFSALLLTLTGLTGLVVSGGSASAAVPGAPSGWTTMFSDDFTGGAGSGLNRANWLYDIGTGYGGGAGNWGTGEIETATDSTQNVYQDGNGHLVIKAIRDGSGHWTSGRVETQRTDFAAPAGGQLQISASIQQPNPASGLGYWPAFWAMGAAARPVGATNWPSIGEIDIMEDVNALSKHSTTFHCGVWAGECHDPDGITSDLQPCAGCQTGYHTYSAIIDRTNTAAEQLRFYLDGNLTYTVNENQVSVGTWQAAIDHGFFAIFDLAIAGSYPDKVCGCNSAAQAGNITSGAAMSVDWFAVYQKSGSGSTTTGGTTTGGTTTGGTTTGGTTTGGTTTGGSTGGSSVSTPDYTASVAQTGPTQAKVTFTPTTSAAYVDIHYQVNGGAQQNLRMTKSGNNWTQTVDNLPNGAVLSYWFTYEKGGPQYDSPHYSYTQGTGSSTTGGTTTGGTTTGGTTTGGTTTGGGGTPQPVPNTIPFVITNNSGRSGPLYIYDLGTQLSSGQQGWADANGTFHAWPGGGNPPTPAPDASIAGPANGQSKTINLPKFSGRVYFSYGQKLNFSLTTGGLVQPAVQNPADPNRNILFNWSEYTLNDSGLWINSTQVDFFSAPYAVSVKTGSGSTLTTGHLKAGGYNAFYTALRNSGWGGLVQTAPDGSVLRALAPSHGIESGGLSATAMNDYINRVWTKYASTNLTVTPFSDQPNLKYTGRVSGNVMNFTNSSGAVVTSFQKPDSDSVFGCYKLLDAPNDLVRGPISRTLCAGYNRTTLLTNPNQPDTGSAGFYGDTNTNQYAKAVHAQMADGKAYAFAFDDVGNYESLVHDGSPQQASLILDPFN